VKHIFSRVHLENQFAQLKKEVAGKYDFKKAIIGNSKAILSVFELIEKSLSVNLTVSITGETGTGKELVAKAIHYNGMRSSGSFIAVNLAALPDELVESELFGHEKGAFTGATARRKGKFEEANGGTIFLDEIAEIDSKVQKKLLRVLQERELSRIGGNETIRVDCRVITATHEDLYQAVKEGRFREDLYYRLLGLPIEMPALRDRGDDILLLAKYFLDRFCSENNILSKNLSEDCRHKLLAYSWPGNVRELKSVIELAAVLSNNADISASDLTLSRSDDMMPELMTESLSLREYNYKIVRFYLNRCEDDTAKVAEKLNIGQSTVYRLLKEFE
jgi:DNA-binding NtrC family response regulator